MGPAPVWSKRWWVEEWALPGAEAACWLLALWVNVILADVLLASLFASLEPSRWGALSPARYLVAFAAAFAVSASAAAVATCIAVRFLALAWHGPEAQRL